jgi:HPt (histidine-containing phosphotransfer) domain-containing protein
LIIAFYFISSSDYLIASFSAYTLNVATTIYLVIVYPLWFIVCCTFAWVYFGAIYGLFKLGQKPLKLKPSTEDRMLGVRSFGDLSLSMSMVYFSAMVILIMIGIASTIGSPIVGFVAFMTKPVRVDDLMAVVEEAIRRNAANVRQPQGIAVPASAGLLDIEELKAQFAEVDAATIERIARTFAEELDRQTAVLEAEGTEISPLHLRGIVHKLSGSASMIGAKHLARMTGNYDAIASAGGELDTAETVPVLLEAIRQTSEEVARYRARLEPSAP